MLSANKIVKVCLLLSYVESLPTESLPTAHLINKFVTASLKKTEVTETTENHSWACLNSLSVLSSDNCDGVLNNWKVPETFNGATVDMTRGFDHCVSLFQKMKEYETMEESETRIPSHVTKQFNLIHNVLKPCRDKVLDDLIKAKV